MAAPGDIVLLPQGRPHHNTLGNQQQCSYIYEARLYDAYLLFSTSTYDLDSGIEFLLF